MPQAQSFKLIELKDLVGPDSWTLFRQFDVKPSFLNKTVNKWFENENYMVLKEAVCTLKVTIECVERALGMLKKPFVFTI